MNRSPAADSPRAVAARDVDIFKLQHKLFFDFNNGAHTTVTPWREGAPPMRTTYWYRTTRFMSQGSVSPLVRSLIASGMRSVHVVELHAM